MSEFEICINDRADGGGGGGVVWGTSGSRFVSGLDHFNPAILTYCHCLNKTQIVWNDIKCVSDHIRDVKNQCRFNVGPPRSDIKTTLAGMTCWYGLLCKHSHALLGSVMNTGMFSWCWRRQTRDTGWWCRLVSCDLAGIGGKLAGGWLAGWLAGWGSRLLVLYRRVAMHKTHASLIKAPRPVTAGRPYNVGPPWCDRGATW